MAKRTLIVSLILLISIGANIYWFGWRHLLEKERREGFNEGVVYVFNIAQNIGQVSYTNEDGGQIVLILQR